MAAQISCEKIDGIGRDGATLLPAGLAAHNVSSQFRIFHEFLGSGYGQTLETPLDNQACRDEFLITNIASS